MKPTNSLLQRDRIEDRIIRRIDRCRQNRNDRATKQDVQRWYQVALIARNTRKQRPLATVGDMIRHQAERSKSDSMLQTLGAGFAG